MDIASSARTDVAALITLNKTKHNGRFRITSFLQLESRTCLPQSRGRGIGAHRPALILLFAKKFFRGPSRTGTYQRFGFAAKPRTQVSLAKSNVTLANEVERSNVLAPGLTKPLLRHHLLPAFTVTSGNDWPWEVVSSYSSATAPGFHGISRADPHTFSSSQRTGSRTSRLRFRAQDLFVSQPIS
jgi:hypothetical protein